MHPLVLHAKCAGRILSIANSLTFRCAFILLPLFVSCARKGTEVSMDPERFIATARIDENLRIELAAREPNVVDPVAIAFDAAGRMYAVEMRDYPSEPHGVSKPLGRVTLLEDTDLDGYYEKATVFADGLQYPTSVLPWRDGVLVTSPPDIVFFKDTNGDGKADIKEVLFSGFPVANTQHNVNGLFWGLDNWVYAANGGNNGTGYSVKSPDRKVSIRGMDFRFRPDTGEIQTSYESTGGFGIATDSWGHMFGTHNTNHIQHMAFRTEYLARNPRLVVPSTRQQISDHESSAQLYQISVPETRFNHPEQSGHFSGGCGLTFYEGGALGAEYDGSFFVTDVVVNVVHQDVVSPDGASFRARRQRDRVEFLAGKDNWFRPVNMAVGPEGALYLVDMHRAVIEHPEWIPDPVAKQLDIWAGNDKGRVYRIVPRSGLKPSRPQFSSAAAQVLVDSLASPNKWRRDTAQRLLVERQDRTAVPLLARLLSESGSPQARVHALWTLEGLGGITPDHVIAALGDAHPGVRESALRIAERIQQQSEPVRQALLGMTRDQDARGRFQLSLSLGFDKDPRVPNALLEIIRQDVEHEPSRIAVLSSLTEGSEQALALLLSTHDPFRTQVTAGRREFVRQLAALTGSYNEKSRISAALRLAGESNLQEGWRISILDGLADGLSRVQYSQGHDPAMRAAIEGMLRSERTPLVRAALRVAAAVGISDSAAQAAALSRATKRALDENLSLERRLEEVELLALGSYDEAANTLLALMEPRQSLDLQVAAARAIGQLRDDRTGRAALSGWRRYSPQVRSAVLNLLLGRTAFHELLVSALEKKQLAFGELNLNLEQRRRLLWHSTEDIKRRAAALFGDQEFSNRKKVVDQYLPEVAHLQGDPAHGEMQFRTLCAKCHVLGNIGTAVGPNLNMAFSKGQEDLLTSILDPNAAIEPEYTNYLVTTKKGDLITGIIKGETPASITLMRANGESDSVLRNEIKEVRTDGLSLMPEGLEQGLKRQDLADLLAFLQQHHD